MLGLADRVRIVDLFEALMKGDAAAALQELRAQYDIGADPAVVLSDLAEFTHFVTRVKVVPAVADDVSLSEAERVRGRAFAAQLSMRVLSRTWQMLLKGVAEVQEAGRPVAAAEMVLVRIAYAADLPTPDEVVRALNGEGGSVARAGGQWRRRCANGRAELCPALRGAARLAAFLGRGFAAAGAGAGRRRAAGADARARQLRGDRRAGAGPARHHHENGVGARRAAGALRGRPPRDRARAERAQDAGARPLAQAVGLDRQALDGGGVARGRRADHARAGRRARRPRSSAACSPTRWCRRCSTASPAPRSSASRRAARHPSCPPPPPSRDRAPRISAWPISSA